MILTASAAVIIPESYLLIALNCEISSPKNPRRSLLPFTEIFSEEFPAVFVVVTVNEQVFPV